MEAVGKSTRARDVEARVRTLLGVAEIHNTAMPVDELSTLLPESGPSTPGELIEWFRRDPTRGKVVGRLALTVGGPAPAVLDLEERQRRGESYLARARDLWQGPLATTLPLVRTVAITGSTAYREPAAGDDIDLMAVTRTGTTWWFLARAFLRLRVRSAEARRGDPQWCLNFVLDEVEAEREFGQPRGFLFAREALTAQILAGSEYYRGLIARASWMRDELPRVYARWDGPRDDAPHTAEPIDPLARIANLVIYPLLATYLQLVGLVRNHRLRARGRTAEGFRTVTSFRRFSLMTQRFEQLSRLYEASPSGWARGAAR